MVNKRGELTTTEIVEIVLGVAVVFVMAWLLYALISPGFDKVDEIADAYLDSFEGVIDDGGGSFSMWQLVDKGMEFYLVYFQNKSSFDGGGRMFYSFGNNVNHVCVCYWDGDDTKCEVCRNLNEPMVIDGEVGESWAVATGQEIEIVDKGDYYEVTKI